MCNTGQGGGRTEIQVRTRSVHGIDGDDDGGRDGRVQGQNKEDAGDSVEQAAMGPTRYTEGGRREKGCMEKGKGTKRGGRERRGTEQIGRRKVQARRNARS